MLPYRDSRFTTILLFVFFAIAIGYTLFEARGQILGPTISVPSGTQEVRDPYVMITGNAQRISSLSMDGNEIPVTKTGDFAEPYVLAPGYNRIVLDAKDSYGRSQEKVIEIMYLPNASSSSPLIYPGAGATSTPTTSSTTVEFSSSTAPVAQ